MLAIFVGVLFLLFILGIPVAFSIGYTCLMVIIAGSGFKDLSFDLFALQMMDGIKSFPLISASFFVLAANVMNTSAITDRIFHFANALVGHLRGGLGHVNVVGSMIFAGMSGTAVSDAAGLGLIPSKGLSIFKTFKVQYNDDIRFIDLAPEGNRLVIYSYIGQDRGPPSLRSEMRKGLCTLLFKECCRCKYLGSSHGPLSTSPTELNFLHGAPSTGRNV